MLIGIGQGRFVGAFQDPQMFELSQTAGQAAAYFTERVGMGHVAEQHRNELRPARKTLGLVFGPVLGDQLMKFRSRKMMKQLTKQAGYLYHGFALLRLVLEFSFASKFYNTTLR